MGLSGLDIALLSPEIAMVVFALVVIFSGLKWPNSSISVYTFLLATAVSICLSVFLWLRVESNGPEMFMNDSLIADHYAIFFKCLILTAIALIILVSKSSFTEFNQRAEFVGLAMLSSVGLMLLPSAADLITIFVAIELASLPIVVLAAFSTHEGKSGESGLKFLVLSAISSALLLYGFAFFYGASGTLQVLSLDSSNPTISEMLVSLDNDIPFGSIPILIATILSVSGLGFKLSIVPFQMWTPDVYEGAPTTVGAMLSVASKAAGFALLLRVLYTVLNHEMISDDWSLLLAILAAITMSIGNLVAIVQKDLKRLLAYSAIAQAGYVLVGVASFADFGGKQISYELGPESVLFYLTGYAAMNVAAFSVVILTVYRNQTSEIKSLEGLGASSPLLAGVLSVSLLALVGIPPTVGFMGKFFIFNAAVNADLAWLAIIGVINSAISAYYYLNIIKIMYLRSPSISAGNWRIGLSSSLVLVITAGATLILGILPQPLLDLVGEASLSII